ncbi:MAG: plastocyanin/azurin family copper-binding protein [Candidatus Limnocylindrales bacterium]
MQLSIPIRRLAALAAVASLVAVSCGGAGVADQTVRPATPPPTAAVVATPIPTVEVTPAPAIGFTPGTVASPRVIEMTVDDNLNFIPGLVPSAPAETVTFKIHNVGTAVHEFMIGKVDAAFADLEGTSEVADIGADQTAELTYTFDGTGPFGFACHAPGHFEHGMLGYIQFVGPGAPTLGTAENPRVVWLNMDDTLKFSPSTVKVAKGETIRFVVTNAGKAIHEIQVGPADKVAADEVEDVIVVEQADLGPGSTHAVDYTFDGAGPYAFACHEPGHYEAGMMGTIEMVAA